MAKTETASTNEYGDIICPYCNTNIMTPPNCQVQQGKAKCLVCRKTFVVTPEIADEANKAVGV